jgi:hypothetical protein
MLVWCSGRRLSGVGRQPLRLLFNTSAVVVTAELTAAKRDFLLNTVLPQAEAKLEALVKVDPVAGNLLASRFCTSRLIPALCLPRRCLPPCSSLLLPSPLVPSSLADPSFLPSSPVPSVSASSSPVI